MPASLEWLFEFACHEIPIDISESRSDIFPDEEIGLGHVNVYPHATEAIGLLFFDGCIEETDYLLKIHHRKIRYFHVIAIIDFYCNLRNICSMSKASKLALNGNSDLEAAPQQALLEAMQQVHALEKVNKETRAILDEISALIPSPEGRITREFYILHYRLLQAAGFTDAAKKFELSCWEWSKLTGLPDASIRRKVREYYKVQTLPATRYSVSVLETACADLLEELPVAGEDGLLRVKNKKYTTLTRWALENGFTPGAVQGRVAEAELIPIRGKTTLGRIREYFLESEVKKACADLMETEQADERGFFIKKGVKYGMAESWADELGLSKSVTSKKLKDLASIEGRDRSGRPTQFYAEQEVRSLFDEYLSLPKVDDDGFKILGKGKSKKRYATAKTWSEKFDIDLGLLRRKLISVDSVDGISQDGLKSKLYSEDQIEEIQKSLPPDLKKANDEGIVYDKGLIHRTINGWYAVTGISDSALKRKLRNAPFIQAQTTNGHIAEYYSERDLRQYCNLTVHRLEDVRDLTSKHVQILERAYGVTDVRQIPTGEEKEIQLMINDVFCNISFVALLKRIAERILKDGNKRSDAKLYLHLIKEGKTPTEILHDIEQHRASMPLALPISSEFLTPDVIHNIALSFGVEEISQLPTNSQAEFEVQQGDKKFKDKSTNFLRRLSKDRFDSYHELAAARSYLECRAGGMSENEAVAMSKRDIHKKTQEYGGEIVPIDSTSVTIGLIEALEKAYDVEDIQQISTGESRRITVKIGKKTCTDSFGAFLYRLAKDRFGKDHRRAARSYLGFKKDGLSEKESVERALKLEEEKLPILPTSPDALTPNFIAELESVWGNNIDAISTRTRDKTKMVIAGKTYQDSFLSFVRRISKERFGDVNKNRLAKVYLVHKKNGSKEDEALNLSQENEERMKSEQLKEGTWDEAVSACACTQDFLRLFEQCKIPGENWKNTRWLQANHFGELYATVLRRFRRWDTFIACMDGYLPFDGIQDLEQAQRLLQQEILRLRLAEGWIEKNDACKSVTQKEYDEIARDEYYKTNPVVRAVADFFKEKRSSNASSS